MSFGSEHLRCIHVTNVNKCKLAKLHLLIKKKKMEQKFLPAVLFFYSNPQLIILNFMRETAYVCCFFSLSLLYFFCLSRVGALLNPSSAGLFNTCANISQLSNIEMNIHGPQWMNHSGVGEPLVPLVQYHCLLTLSVIYCMRHLKTLQLY